MRTFVLLIVVVVSGCATQTPIASRITEQFEPDVGSVSTRELGDSLVSYQYAVTKPTVRVVSHDGSNLIDFQMKIGSNLEPVETRGDIAVYRSHAPDIGGPLNNLVCHDRVKNRWSSAGPFGECIELGFAANGYIYDSLEVEPSQWVDATAPNVQQQLIYNGRIDDYVKFTYREFSIGGYARDAFTQDVQYDLDEGNVIGFKGSRIEILEATNRQITYKLISHFKGVSL